MKKIIVLVLALLACFAFACGPTPQPDPKPDPEPTVVEVESVSFSETAIEMLEGEDIFISATVLPNNATNKTLTWTSSKEDVASVSNRGIILALSEGETVITATSNNGKSATLTVTVKKPPVAVTSVSLNQASLSLYVGEIENLTATVLPENATDKTLTWKSSNEQVVKVENGKITALSKGTSTITVSTSNSKTATCTVAVDLYYTRIGDKVQLGYIPKNVVTDSETVSALEGLTPDKDGIIEYNMKKYAKATAKPYAERITFDNGTAIVKDTVYYFECAPLTFTVIAEDTTSMLILCDEIIGATAFNGEYVETEYDDSLLKTYVEGIRKMALNDKQELIVTAFDIPTIDELTKEGNGFNVSGVIDVKREAEVTDYAKAQGAYAESLEGYENNGIYWLKDNGTVNEYAAYVDFNGIIEVEGYMVNATHFGVRPMFTISK